ncbi:hypothetical protein B9Z65_4786 [Elsinoe australis]|uniref:Uncharacterized protein n=1 Tax=Elsinoe australis TaxID=40998 RepID=A0A2P8A626_9PEZI|nr:hypothetical protein B9Z65_4786 [Elsinoe australis]
MTSAPSTPPPAQRLHTPPTPLHGSKYDNWAPYSPRRSSRVQEKQRQDFIASPPSAARGNSKSHALLKVTSTPKRSRVRLESQETHQTLSPPCSPNVHQQQAQSGASITQEGELTVDDLFGYDGSSDRVQAPEGMLPTPRKTPRRRDVNSTARIINFRPHAPADVLPTPRKRKNRVTLDSPQDSPSSSRINVFTDSQDCLPEMDHSDDNPFVGPRQTTRAGRKRKDRRNDDERTMDRLVQEGKGMIFMFRGKKIFRPYEEHQPTAEEEEPDHRYRNQNSRIRSAAGHTADRPLTRSSVRPRLLFTDEEQHDEMHNSDEEALTDIEEQDEHRDHSGTEEAKFDSSAQEDQDLTQSAAIVVTEETPSLAPPQLQLKWKKPSPFDSWPRQKPGSSSRSTSTKRSAPPTDEESVGKRTRSSNTSAN